MNTIKLILALCLIIGFVVIQNNDAFGQCKAKESCSVDDDTGNSPICETADYTACDNWLVWNVYFTRTSQTEESSTIVCRVDNSGWSRTYHSGDFDPSQSYHFEGTHYCSSKVDHSVIIERYGPTGNYSDITITAEYVADDPTK